MAGYKNPDAPHAGMTWPSLMRGALGLPPDSVPPTEAELAGAARPASAIRDVTGRGVRFEDIRDPRAGTNPGGLDGPLGDSGLPAPLQPPGKPAASKPVTTKPVPPSPAPAAGPPPSAAGSPVASAAGVFTPVQTANPASPFDEDLEIAHDMSRMLASAGFGDRAQKWRAQFMDLQTKRYGVLADQTMRHFNLTGDPSAFIALHNHGVPNSRQITGYRKDGNDFVFQTSDGKESPKVAATDIFRAIETYKNPGFIAGLMLLQAQAQAKTAGDATKHTSAMLLEDRKSLNRIREEMVKAGLKPDDWKIEMSSNVQAPYTAVRVRKSDGYTEGLDVNLKGPGGVKLPPQWVPISSAPATPGAPAAAPPASGLRPWNFGR